MNKPGKKKSKSGFDDVTFEFDGEAFTIPADDVFPAICVIERDVTLVELYRMAASRENYRLAQIARGYASALRCAGAKVDDEEVYGALFGDSDIPEAQAIVSAIGGLLDVLTPPSAKKKRAVKGSTAVAAVPAADTGGAAA